MKKIIYLFVLLIGMVSCEKDKEEQRTVHTRTVYVINHETKEWVESTAVIQSEPSGISGAILSLQLAEDMSLIPSYGSFYRLSDLGLNSYQIRQEYNLPITCTVQGQITYHDSNGVQYDFAFYQ